MYITDNPALPTADVTALVDQLGEGLGGGVSAYGNGP